ncbi:ribosomal protein S18-alanine N-acetyltransferase [Roseateles sp. BYS180W]|uniref:[Ribosomal protein bS18]-alanine N-acetyltransferase n=1 Tax=Roseateles rivi TaxID=3299028 RepID=A0ABW7FWN7_9BURK
MPLQQALLQPLQGADLDELLPIEAAAYSHPWTRGNFIDSLSAGYLAFVWRDDAAQLQAYYLAMAVVDELHLLNFTVHPQRQGQGLGRAMLSHLVAQARARACSKVWLEVRQSNARARTLYARNGFVELGLRRGYYPAVDGREDAVLMALALEDSHGLD